MAALLPGALVLIAAGPPPPPAELTQAEATGVLSRMVRDQDGKDIGRIVDVVVEPSGQPRAIVIDVGGFMGVGSRKVAVAWGAVHVPPPSAPDPKVTIDLSDAQVKDAPDYTDRSKPATIVGPAIPPAETMPAEPPTPIPPASPPENGSDKSAPG